MPSKSRTVFWYSVRVNRWNSGNVPGFGFAAAARSSSVSRNVAVASYVALSGRGEDTGGIEKDRSFRTTFSQTSGFALTRDTSVGSSTSPAVLSRSLWQVAQYCWITAAAGVGRGACAETVRTAAASRIAIAAVNLFIELYSSAEEPVHVIVGRPGNLGDFRE